MDMILKCAGADRKKTMELVTRIKSMTTPICRITKPACKPFECIGCKSHTDFITDHHSSDVVCRSCGLVAKERQPYDGDWTRSFADDSQSEKNSKSQHGPGLNPYLSMATNLKTCLQAPYDGTVSKSLVSALKETQAMVENSSTVSTQDNRGFDRVATRQEYKDNQKIKIWRIMEEYAERADIMNKDVSIAKRLFATYRDNIERLAHVNEVVAACLIAAQGITRKRKRTNDELYPFACKDCSERFNTKKSLRWHLKTHK